MFFTLLLLVGVNHVCTNYASMPIYQISKMAAILLFVVFFMLGTIVSTIKYDKYFRSKVMDIASKDTAMRFFPVSITLLLSLRFFRGATYLGGVLFYYLPIKPMFAIHRYLIQQNKFSDNITGFIKFVLLVMVISFLSIVVLAVGIWLNGLLIA